MARKVSRKSLKHDEFVEAAFDFEQWIEEHWMPLAWVAGTALAITLAVWGWSWWSARTNAESARIVAEGMRELQGPAGGEAASPAPPERYRTALASFERAAQRAPRSAAGKAARFYEGASLLRLGKPSEAIAVLEPLAGSADGFLADAARAQLAWSYAQAQQTDRAVQAWQDLAARTDAAYPADIALYNAATILAGAGRGGEAKALLEDVTARFPQGPAFQDASKLLAKLGGKVAAAGG